MLAPLSNVFGGLDPVLNTTGDVVERQTLQEWYSGPTYFYKLAVGADGEIAEQQLNASADLEAKIKKLAPRMSLPKAAQKLDIPFNDASEIEVMAAGDHCGLHDMARPRSESEGTMTRTISKLSTSSSRLILLRLHPQGENLRCSRT